MRRCSTAQLDAAPDLIKTAPSAEAPSAAGRLRPSGAASGLACAARTRYDEFMPDAETRATPSPLPPTEAELAEWNALSREEQVSRYRGALSHPDCAIVIGATMAEILAEAQARAAAPRHG